MYVSLAERVGEKRGKLEGKLETARNMLQDSMSLELISKFTGLSMDEIRGLREE